MSDNKKTPPKGGRKGGTIFPRTGLKQASDWARKLVSKTHTGPQPPGVIHSGVVGAKGGMGDVRISALRQYGYLTGDKATGFLADGLAKKLVAAPPEEMEAVYREAVLRPKVLKSIFDTFIGDKVSRAKLRQRALDLKVHPEEADACIDVYIESLGIAKLISVDGDQIQHVSTAPSSAQSSAPEASDKEPKHEQNVVEDDGGGSAVVARATANGGGVADHPPQATGESETSPQQGFKGGTELPGSGPPRAIFNVNVTLDSSLDTEKLAKQLELLKRYGAI